jgi:predicted transcriptional regulator
MELRMSTLTKRTTIYFDPEVYRILRIKADSTSKSISEIIDSAIRQKLAEDEEDLKIFEERADEPTIPFEEVIKELKESGKI